MAGKIFDYFAFISYSHKDKKIAKKLQKRLESYHLPYAIQKSNPTLPQKLSPVFIDEYNLVAAAQPKYLPEALQGYLGRSNYLIVICSPNSAKSEYVNDEVEFFVRTGRTRYIIPLIVDGVAHSEYPNLECLPRAILTLPKEKELLGIDVKKFGEHDAFFRIVATMLGLDLEKFISREARQRKRKTFILSSIVLAVAFIAGMFLRNSIDTFILMQDSDAEVQFGFGMIYQKKQNYAKAVEYYQKAAAQGLASAQYHIGYMYLHGLGVPPSNDKAIEYFTQAAQQGHETAKSELQKLSPQDK